MGYCPVVPVASAKVWAVRLAMTWAVGSWLLSACGVCLGGEWSPQHRPLLPEAAPGVGAGVSLAGARVHRVRITALASLFAAGQLASDGETVVVNTDNGGLWSANLADWLAGIGTVATAAISVFLLWRERGDRERQRAREALAEDSARRRQASRVHLAVPVRGTASGEKGSHWDVDYTAELANGSAETISDVDVTCVIVNPDGGEAVRQRQRTPTLALGASARAQTPRTRMPWREPAEFEAWSEAEFTDAAGLRWRRDAEHRLSEISPLPAGPVAT